MPSWPQIHVDRSVSWVLGFKAHITMSNFPCHVLISTPKKASLKKHHNFVMNPLLYQYIINNSLILHIQIFWISLKTKYVHCNWLLHFSLFKLTAFYPCSLSLAFLLLLNKLSYLSCGFTLYRRLMVYPNSSSVLYISCSLMVYRWSQSQVSPPCMRAFFVLCSIFILGGADICLFLPFANVGGC